MNQSMFINKARSILSDNAGIRRLPNQRSGKFLDESRLGLVKAGHTRVFQKPVRRQFYDYHICIAIDCSGSMAGEKMRSASWATHATARALEISGAHISVIAFARLVVEIPKAIWSNPSKMLEFCAKFMEIRLENERGEYLNTNGGGNHDWEAIIKSTNLLLEKSSPGKIMLVMSDGLPSCGFGQKYCSSYCLEGNKGMDKMMHQVIADARNKGITVLAIGIYQDTSIKYYGARQTRVINSVNQLYSEMASILEKNIVRG